LLQVTEENRGANPARLSTARLNEKAADIVFGEKNSNEIWGILSSWKLDLLDSARGVMINQIHKIQFSYEEFYECTLICATFVPSAPSTNVEGCPARPICSI